MTTFPNPVNLKLSGVDYLCLKMQSNPGQSKRYYLKQKNIYQNGSDYSNGGNGMAGYFAPGCFYDENLWMDCSSNRPDNFAKRKNWMGRTRYQPKKCRMYLTAKGWDRANKARQKIGLEPINP